MRGININIVSLIFSFLPFLFREINNDGVLEKLNVWNLVTKLVIFWKKVSLEINLFLVFLDILMCWYQK